MTKDEILATIDRVLPQLADIDYVMLGTCNLYIQGITELVPKDFDILTNDDDIRKVAKKFESKIYSGVDSKYLETEFYLDDIEIHFVSAHLNPLRPDDFTNHTNLIDFDGRIVPCLSLESEYDAYSQMGREKDLLKLPLIKAKLNQ